MAFPNDKLTCEPGAKWLIKQFVSNIMHLFDFEARITKKKWKQKAVNCEKLLRGCAQKHTGPEEPAMVNSWCLDEAQHNFVLNSSRLKNKTYEIQYSII